MSLGPVLKGVTRPVLKSSFVGDAPVIPGLFASTFSTGNYFNTIVDPIADSKVGILSSWFYANTTLSNYIISNLSERLKFSFNGANPRILLQSDISILWHAQASAISTGQWHHLMSSWDLSVPVVHIYLDGVSDIDTTFTPATDGTIQYADGNEWAIGATTSGTVPHDGKLSENYLNGSDYLDLSVAANGLKFRTAAGLPENLGPDGSLPTGNQPDMYFPNGRGDENKGSAGNFTEKGTVTTAADGPGA